MALDYSVIVPVHNEQDNVASLLREIVVAGGAHGSFEVIFVDDSSQDKTVDVLVAARADHPCLRILAHERNCGQSSAIRTGVQAAGGRLIVVLDGDGQNDPADIPKLLRRYEELAQTRPIGMVSGRRVKRKDTMGKRAASRIGNGVRQWILRDHAVDVGCGLKVFARDNFLALPYFDHMHRYMPTLMLRQGLEVDFVAVNHRPRLHGQSNYGIFDRLWVGLGDILGVIWLKRRCRLPRNPREIRD